MHIVYLLEDIPQKFTKSIYLAGPVPSSKNIRSWRDFALLQLKNKKFDGVVFVPEIDPRKKNKRKIKNEEKRKWEWDALHMSDVILFWVPSDSSLEPRTQIYTEFAYYLDHANIVYGRSNSASRTDYLDWLIESADRNRNIYERLDFTIEAALKLIEKGATRKGGERKVPLFIWRTNQFQSWYKAQKNAGNRLDDAELLFFKQNRYRKGKPRKVFMFALWVKVWILTESRHKENELIISRPDISAICAYKKNEKLEDTDIILVREFRSPVSNKDCFVQELPSGSSFYGKQDELLVASEELKEETDLSIPAERFKYIGSKQLCATVSTHKAHLYAVAITEKELEKAIASDKLGEAHGILEDSERTYVTVRKLKDLAASGIDWSMLGMLHTAILNS